MIGRFFTIGLMCLSVLVVSSCARKSQNFYFGNYSEAERHYNRGEYTRAIEKYQAYRDENPQGNLAVIAQYYIGKSYQALGENDKARQYYQDIIDNYPDLVWANFSKTQLNELS